MKIIFLIFISSLLIIKVHSDHTIGQFCQFSSDCESECCYNQQCIEYNSCKIMAQVEKFEILNYCKLDSECGSGYCCYDQKCQDQSACLQLIYIPLFLSIGVAAIISILVAKCIEKCIKKQNKVIRKEIMKSKKKKGNKKKVKKEQDQEVKNLLEGENDQTLLEQKENRNNIDPHSQNEGLQNNLQLNLINDQDSNILKANSNPNLQINNMPIVLNLTPEQNQDQQIQNQDQNNEQEQEIDPLDLYLGPAKINQMTSSKIKDLFKSTMKDSMRQNNKNLSQEMGNDILSQGSQVQKYQPQKYDFNNVPPSEFNVQETQKINIDQNSNFSQSRSEFGVSNNFPKNQAPQQERPITPVSPLAPFNAQLLFTPDDNKSIAGQSDFSQIPLFPQNDQISILKKVATPLQKKINTFLPEEINLPHETKK